MLLHQTDIQLIDNILLIALIPYKQFLGIDKETKSALKETQPAPRVAPVPWAAAPDYKIFQSTIKTPIRVGRVTEFKTIFIRYFKASLLC